MERPRGRERAPESGTQRNTKCHFAFEAFYNSMEDPSVSSVSKEGKELVEEQIGVSDETLKKIADTLLRDESIKTYNVTELFVDEESMLQVCGRSLGGQIMEKKVRCLKGSSLFDWFMDEKNQKKLGVQIRGETDVAVVMELMMEQGYFHKAEKIEVKGERGKIIQRVKSTVRASSWRSMRRTTSVTRRYTCGTTRVRRYVFCSPPTP